MGNTVATMQQWSPNIGGSETYNSIPLDERPHRIVLECPIAGDSQQLLRCETREKRFLEEVATCFNETKYSLREQWYPRATKREADVLIIYVHCNEKNDRFSSFRVGPRSIQLLESSSSASQSSSSASSWLHKAVSDVGQYDKLWRYETEENFVWPLHTLLYQKLLTSKDTVRLPLVLVRLQQGKREEEEAERGEEKTATNKEQDVEEESSVECDQVQLVWSLVYKAQAGKENEVAQLRRQMIITEQKSENDVVGGGSASDEENEEKTMANSENLHDKLISYLDFDEPWRLTGAIDVDAANAECIASITAELKTQFSPEDEPTDFEIGEFVKRRIAQLLKAGHTYLPDSFRDPMCVGLALPSIRQCVYTPFDCDATIVMHHRLVPTTLQEQALTYHAPEDAEKMVAMGKALIKLVDEHCLDNAIPQSRLKKAAAIVTGKNSNELRDLFLLKRSGEWLVFWGSHGYGFTQK